jgi:hypothetical protein
VHLGVRDGHEHVDLRDVGLPQDIDLARGKGRNRGRRIVTQIDESNGLEIGLGAPIVRACLEDRDDADLVLDHGEGTGAVRAHTELPVFFRIHDGVGVVEQVLRDRDLRKLQIEAHRMVVDFFDGVGSPDLGGHFRVALVILLARVDLLEQIGLHEADRRRSGRRIEDVVEVPHHVVGDEGSAAMPLDVLAQIERPGLEVVARLPALSEQRPRDAVLSGAGERLGDVEGYGRRLRPVMRMRMGYLVHPHADLGCAALRQGRLGRSYEVLARDLADECICRGRRQAKPGRILQEFPSR